MARRMPGSRPELPKASHPPLLVSSVAAQGKQPLWIGKRTARGATLHCLLETHSRRPGADGADSGCCPCVLLVQVADDTRAEFAKVRMWGHALWAAEVLLAGAACRTIDPAGRIGRARAAGHRRGDEAEA